MNNFKLKMKILSVFICFGLVFGMQVAAAAEEEGNRGYIVGSSSVTGPSLEQEQADQLDALKGEVAVFSEKIREYYIGLNDVLDISVWRLPELSKEAIVRPDGRISYPLIGDIEVYGLTLTELDKVLTEKLSVYIREPQVLIAIKAFGGKKVFVLGEVGFPGTYKFISNTTIIEIISKAGGFTDRASCNSVILVRPRGQEEPELRRINCSRILKKADLRQNIAMMPQDIIYVPRSFIGSLEMFATQISPAINDAVNIQNLKTSPW